MLMFSFEYTFFPVAHDLVERYNNAGPEGKNMLEMQHGKLNILKLIQEVASNTFINTECKPCPNCKSPILVSSASFFKQDVIADCLSPMALEQPVFFSVHKYAFQFV